MYHYTESGLSNIILTNGYHVEVIDGEEYTSIDDMNGLHNAIAQAIVDKNGALTNEAFKFLRVELNISQKALGDKFDVSEQTIARYEKTTKVPRVTDVALRSLYMESLNKNNSISFFLDLLADTEARGAFEELILEEVDRHWRIAA